MHVVNPSIQNNLLPRPWTAWEWSYNTGTELIGWSRHAHGVTYTHCTLTSTPFTLQERWVVYIDNWKHSQWVPWVIQVTCSCFCCSLSLTTLPLEKTSLKSLSLSPSLLKALLPFLLPCSSPFRACCSHQRGRLFTIDVLSLLNGLLFLNFQKSNLTWHCTHAEIISSAWGLLRLTPIIDINQYCPSPALPTCLLH